MTFFNAIEHWLFFFLISTIVSLKVNYWFSFSSLKFTMILICHMLIKKKKYKDNRTTHETPLLLHLYMNIYLLMNLPLIKRSLLNASPGYVLTRAAVSLQGAPDSYQVRAPSRFGPPSNRCHQITSPHPIKNSSDFGHYRIKFNIFGPHALG